MLAVKSIPRFAAQNSAYVCRALALALIGVASVDVGAGVLSMNETEQLALLDEPGAAGLVARSESLRESALAAGELPDPRMRVGLMNYPLEQGGFGTEGMTQILVGVHQPLPTGAARDARASITDAKADGVAHQANARQRDVLLAARQAWLETHRWQQSRQLVERSRTVFMDLVTITGAAYAVGRRSQHDLLQAELELSRLDDRIAQITGNAAVARAELARWIGQDQAARQIAGALPSWNEPAAPAVLAAGLASHPLIGAADAAIAGEGAAVRLAETAYRPDWGLDVSYGYRDGRLPDGRSRSDFVSVMVTVDLPVFRNRRQDRVLAASQGGKRAAIGERAALLRSLTEQLAVAHARYLSLDERIAYYDTTIAARSRARSDAAMAAYQSGAGDFNDLIRSQQAELDIEMQRLNLAVDRASARVRIAWLTEVR